MTKIDMLNTSCTPCPYQMRSECKVANINRQQHNTCHQEMQLAWILDSRSPFTAHCKACLCMLVASASEWALWHLQDAVDSGTCVMYCWLAQPTGISNLMLGVLLLDADSDMGDD